MLYLLFAYWVGLTGASVWICVDKKRSGLALLLGSSTLLVPFLAYQIGGMSAAGTSAFAAVLTGGAALFLVGLLAPIVRVIVAMAAKRR